MKTFQLFFISALIATFAAGQTLAQTSQGTWIVNGNVGLAFDADGSRTKSDDGDGEKLNTSAFDFSPAAGYFVIDNLVVGLSLPVSFSRLKDEDNEVIKTSSFTVTPFARYYFNINRENIMPYGSFAVGLGNTIIKGKDANGDQLFRTKLNTFLLDIGGGMAFFVSDKVSVDLGLSYVRTRLKNPENNTNNTRTISNGFDLKVGFSIFF